MAAVCRGLPVEATGPKRGSARSRTQARSPRQARGRGLVWALWGGLGLGGLGLGGLGLGGCDDGAASATPDAYLTWETLALEYAQVLPCRDSHDHDLRSVRILANAAAVERYVQCVRLGHPCDAPFEVGATLVKYEYELPGCVPAELVSITVSERLPDGSFPEGGDWRWLRLGPDLKVEEDGAPTRCLDCHRQHCAPPSGLGHELRCVPD